MSGQPESYQNKRFKLPILPNNHNVMFTHIMDSAVMKEHDVNFQCSLF